MPDGMPRRGSTPLLLAARAVGHCHRPTGMDLLWRALRRRDAALRLVEALVAPGQVIVDAGASVGLFTSRMARLVGPSGRVHAFEPNPQRHARLRSLAGRRRPIVLHPVALSDTAGEAQLWIPRVEGHVFAERAFLDDHGGDRASADPVAVSLATFDAELGEDRDRVAFIKCDVEGHEAAVLAGAAETLERARPAVLVEVEERHHTLPLDDVLAAVVPDGYDAWAVTQHGLRPAGDIDIERDHRAPLREAGDDTPGPDYVNDFLLLPHGRRPPADLILR
jgi:FkbM family methyltransferase